MSITQIRRFRLAYMEYRHVINLKTDEVFLQHLDEETAQWVNLLKFDPHCDVFDAATGKRIGHFRTGCVYWVFHDETDGGTVVCDSTSGAESLLDSEITISKRWLAAQP